MATGLLLLDLNFGPGHTDGQQGLRLLREVLAQPHAPVVLAMTAYADLPLAVQAIKLRCLRLCDQALGQRAPGGHLP